jgi:hypothetical protein
MESLNPLLIAPCGMNCGVCIAHLRDKNSCPGCRFPDPSKSITRVRCKIKTCAVIRKGDATFCFECKEFPCEALKHLDKRYRTKYHMSMIENLEYIKKLGLKKFIVNEQKRWSCSHCGGTICVHKRCCYICGKKIGKELFPVKVL